MSAKTIAPAIVTAEWLESLTPCPCDGAIAAFRREWPDGVEMSEGVVARADALTLDYDWFAHHHFSKAAWEEYRLADEAAWAGYKRATALEPALAEYARLMAAAFVVGWRATFTETS